MAPAYGIWTFLKIVSTLPAYPPPNVEPCTRLELTVALLIE